MKTIVQLVGMRARAEKRVLRLARIYGIENNVGIFDPGIYEAARKLAIIDRELAAAEHMARKAIAGFSKKRK
jgi:hypothetical protein